YESHPQIHRLQKNLRNLWMAYLLPSDNLTELFVGEDCMADKAKLVTGLFKSKIAAESAVDALLKRGFSRDDISVLMSDATRSKEFALQTRSHAADGLG